MTESKKAPGSDGESESRPESEIENETGIPDSQTPALAPAETTPGPKRRKQRRQRASKRRKQLTERAPLDAQGRERPRFLLSFPEHPELDRLIAAFEAGNYALVRREAPGLAERTDDHAVRDAALELRRRIDPDPLITYLLGASVALLAFLIIYFYSLHRD